METVYFETSGFNYLLKSLRWEAFIGTRELQKRSGRELFISPVTAWELMLTCQFDSDFLLYCAQNLFSAKMLGTPTELVIRYLRNAYPKNTVNYDIFTGQKIGEIWEKMVHSNSVTIEYDQEELLNKTKMLRLLSSNLSAIARYPNSRIENEFIKDIAHVLHTVYECLVRDGFLGHVDSTKYDIEVLAKLYALWVMGIFLLRFDFYNSPVEEFWTDEGFEPEDHLAKLMHIIETYQELLHRGPIMEMTIMSYHQLMSGRKNRGLLLDSMHCVYAPYVDTIVSADEDFRRLATLESQYSKKIIHIEDIGLREVPYI